MTIRRSLFAGCALVLLVAVAMSIYGEMQPTAGTMRQSLQSLLPPTAAGWKLKIRPLAESPEMQETVRKILNYDDAVYAEYSNGPSVVSVYLAYWRPRKMSHRLVSRHTPDTCWIKSGWECRSRESHQRLRTLAGVPLVDAQVREMTIGDRTEHLVFWHISSRGSIQPWPEQPPWWEVFYDLGRFGMGQADEQWFIRISSTEPMANWWSRPIFQELIAGLTKVAPGLIRMADTPVQ